MGKNTPQKLWNGIEPSTENVHSFGFATFSYGSSQNKKRRPLLYFIDPITPKNVGKLTSETTFGHSTVFFRPSLRTKRANPLIARFGKFGFPKQHILKLSEHFSYQLALFFWEVVKDCCGLQ